MAQNASISYHLNPLCTCLSLQQGTLLGKIVVTDVGSDKEIKFFDPNLLNLPSLVSTPQLKCFNEAAKDKLHIIAVDCGIKYNQVSTTEAVIVFSLFSMCVCFECSWSFKYLLTLFEFEI